MAGNMASHTSIVVKPNVAFRRLMALSALMILLLFFLNVHASPVFVGGDSSLDACGGYGKTKQLTKLRKSATAQKTSEVVLPVGTELYICSESADGKWLGVVVQNSDASCGVSSPQKKRAAYKGKCKSGWVPTTLVDYLAG